MLIHPSVRISDLFDNMKVVVEIFSYLICLQVLYAQKIRCDYKHIADAGIWLKYHEKPATAADASSMCLYEGGRLAGLVDADLQQNPAEMEKLVIATLHADVFLQVNNNPVKDRATMAFSKSGKLIIPDDDYTTLLPYYCFATEAESIVVNECGTVDKEYQLDSRTGKCYKLHRVHATWPNARDACVAEGAHLAVLNSAAEADALRDLFAKYPQSAIPGCCWKDEAFVGFRLKNNEWLTIFDQTLSEAGYDVWTPGEPNNARGDEFCGSLGRNGMFFDDPCSRGLPYFCERDADTPDCVTVTQVLPQSPDENEIVPPDYERETISVNS